MKLLKKILAVALAGMFFVGGIEAFSEVNASSGGSGGYLAAQEQKTENLYKAAEDGQSGINIGMEAGFEADLSDTVFDGSKIVEVSNAEDMGLFQENIKNANSLKISITFQLAEDADGTYFNLLELCNSKKNNPDDFPAEEIALIISDTGHVYLMTGAQKESTTWQLAGGAVRDGASHTLEVTVSGKSLSVRMDGGEEKTISEDGSAKSFFQAFFGGTADGYTDWRSSVDMIRVGGLKEGTFQAHTNFKNFKGQISFVTIAGANDLSDLTGSGVSAGMFEPVSLDNTWLFGGGAETQGRFAEIGGIRNYIGQFEEYVRWVKRIDSTLYGLQRYTINAGKAGCDAVSFAEGLDGYISRVQPKAVAYLIGPEDYTRGEEGIADFQAAIAEIMETALAMKDDNGYAVIQLPHAVRDGEMNAAAALYANAAAETVREALLENEDRIALVDHFGQTNNSTFKDTMLTEDGLLNAKGHHEIARQFSKVVQGSTDGFPQIEGDWKETQTPDNYLDIAPEAAAGDNSLEISILGGTEADEWIYIVQTDGTEITGTASGNPFTIENLPAGKDYKLTVRTKDENTQFSAVKGIIEEGNQAKVFETDGIIPQKIREMAENKEKPLTWLFMGDSITHAAAHTKGYDGIAQLFEKYLKEDLGREDDIVVNTAVSGAQTVRTMENLEQRMTKYRPDIVSIMLGTNDTRDQNIYSQYKSNLKNIVNAVREANPDAVVIFRSPTPGNGAWKSGPAGEDGSVARMKQVAEEDGNILFIDQHTRLREELDAYPYLFDASHYFGDGLVHPGAAGHVLMTTQFIRECGLNTNTKIANLSYEFEYEEEQSEIVPEVIKSETYDSVTISKSDLQAVYEIGEIGDLTVSCKDSDDRIYRKSAGLGETEATVNLPSDRRYQIEVTANIKGSSAKHVSFAKQEIRLSGGIETAEDEAAANTVIKQIDALASAEDITADRAAAEALQNAYNALTKIQKQLIPIEKLKTFKQIIKVLDEKDPADDKNDKNEEGGGTGSNTEDQKPQIAQTAKEGETYPSGSCFYKVTSISNQTVELTGMKASMKGIKVLDTVKLFDKDYKVTSIGASAFKNNKRAAGAVIGKNVETIGNHAFAGCKNLKKVTVKSVRLKKIGSKAFLNCKELKTIAFKTKVLKSVGSNAFKGIHKNAKIKVPSNKLKAYKKTLAKKGQGKKVRIIK